MKGRINMACFLVPETEAIITTVISKVVKSHETKIEEKGCEVSQEEKVPFSKKLNRLSGFLWGGSGLLAFEHLWHGEISPFFPFLTAAQSPEQMAVAFHEMATVGTSMALIVTMFWAIITFVGDKIIKRSPEKTMEESV